MKNKGFTVVELLVSFSLTMIIAVFLFEVLIEVKDVFTDTSVRTAIQEKASIISKNIDNLLAENNNTISCNSSSTMGNCQINGKSLRIDKDNNRVIIDGQNFDLPQTVSIKDYSIQNRCNENNCYIHVQMTLDSNSLTKEYDYDVIYYFNADPSEVPPATFQETGTNPKVVTITYPDGCSSKYTCSYQIDDREIVPVETNKVNLEFTNNATVTATVQDDRTETHNSYNVEVAMPIDLTIAIQNTSNSITVMTNAFSDSPITKYEYSIDGGNTWVPSDNNTYTFTHLKNGTNYNVAVRVTNASGAIATANRLATTSSIPSPSFNETGVVPKTVTITYPEGCGDRYICTYQKNSDIPIAITSASVNVKYTSSGTLVAQVSDGVNTISETYNVAVTEDTLTLSISATSTTNSITVIAGASSVSNITKYEFSLDNGQTWQTSNTNTYTYTNLKQQTEYTAMTRVTNETGKTSTATQKISTKSIPLPTFKENGVYPKTVTITFPEGCGTTYTCSYVKDNGTEEVVTTQTKDVSFDYHGDIVAYVSDGTNEVSSAYTVQIQLSAEDLSYDNAKTKMECEDAQCALDELKKMLN